jgi:hypothetical protein
MAVQTGLIPDRETGTGGVAMTTYCPFCGSERTRNSGEGNGFTQYLCEICNHPFIPNFDIKKYKQSIDWEHTFCRLHPNKKATHQINPPIGGFFCNECGKLHQIMRIQSMGVGW